MILKRNCNVIKEFTLDNHLAGIAMKIKKLPLKGEKNVVDAKATFNSNMLNPQANPAGQNI